MKKTLLGIFIFAMVFFGFVSAGNIKVNNMSTAYGQCNLSESADINYYLTQSLDRNPYDTFGNNVDSFISASNTYVDIWRNGVISNCSDRGRVSNALKGTDQNGVLAMLNVDGCRFNIPSYNKVSNPTALDAQIHYKIGYYTSASWPRGSTITDRFYYRDYGQNSWNCYPDGESVGAYSYCPEKTVRYNTSLKTHIGECLNYRVFRCGDGLVNKPSALGGGTTNYTNGTYVEQCDPNDPNHAGWGNGGCSNTCQPINQPQPYCGNGILEAGEQCDPGSGNFGNGCDSSCKLMTPSCTVLANPNSGIAPLTTTFTATKPSRATYTEIRFGDYGPSNPLWHVENPIFPLTHTYTWAANFMVLVNVKNNYNGQINGTLPTAECSTYVNVTNQPQPPQPSCGNGILEAGEQCDPGSGNFGNGCDSSCKLMIPTCTVTATPNSGTVSLITTFTATKPNWATYTEIRFGDYGPNNPLWHVLNPVFPLTHTYTWAANFIVLVNVKNNYNGQINGTLPTAECSTHVKVTTQPEPPQPSGKLTILKELLTTGDFLPGSLVSYKITLKNVGSGVFPNAFIRDTMPRTLTYVSSRIQGPTSFNHGVWINPSGFQIVEYSGFNLNPGATAVLYLTGRIKPGFTYDRTNCALTSGNLVSCVIYPAPAPMPHVLKWQKVGNMDYTRSVISVNPGDQISYKIDFKNKGLSPAIAMVKDYLPNCIDYVSSSIHGVTGARLVYSTGINIVLYRDFNLAPGQTGYMLITGQVKNQGLCANTTTYLNTGSLKFLTPAGNEIYSTVLANRGHQGSEVVFDKVGNKSQLYPGETGLEFMIKVTNRGPNTISNIYVDDIWPDNESCIIYDGWTGRDVEEVSHLRRHYIKNTGRNGSRGSATNNNPQQGGSFYVQTTSLPAGQSFDFVIFAHVANNPACVGSYVNTGKLMYDVGGKTHILYDTYPFTVVANQGMNIAIKKTVDKTTVSNGETLTYNIIYENHGDKPLINYTIVDYLPQEIEFISSNPQPTQIVGNQISRFFDRPLLPGKAGVIAIMGKVRLPQQNNTNNTIINKACIDYENSGLPKPLCDDAIVTYAGQNYACQYISSPGNFVVIDEDTNNGSMTFSCATTDGMMANNIKIDCGNGQYSIANNASSHTYSCHYTYNNNGNNTYNVQCIVNGEIPTNPTCIKNVTAGYGYYGNCGNGVMEPGEECDLKLSRGVSAPIGTYLDYVQQHFAGSFGNNGYSCRNCKIVKGGLYVYEPVQCLQTDTPISLMDNEILPFWWRLWNKDSQQIKDNYSCRATNVADRADNDGSKYQLNQIKNDKTIIKKDSMRCHFAVYNGKNNQQPDNPVQKFKVPCFQNENNTPAIFDYFGGTHGTLRKASGKYWNTINAILGGIDSLTTFGEYKIVLEKVEYKYCDTTDGARKDGKVFGAVCEVNFAVTEPYIMQVSTFGVNPVASTNPNFLKKFYDMNGNQLIDKTDISQTMKVDGIDYRPTYSALDKMDEFKNKYEKLAIKINSNFKINGTQTVGDLFGQNSTVKKVPNASIYFVEGNGSLVLEQKKLSRGFNQPYTIYVKGMDVHIKGDVLTTAMIITDKKMYFDDAMDGTNGRCQKGGQVAQGIFVTKGGFGEGERYRNTRENQQWCAWGNLWVKGVLIGDNIEGLMNSKRSQLNGWFTVNNANPQKVLIERRKKILAGASVLIEYNPSLWQLLPPGAEVFTESLEVYRK